MYQKIKHRDNYLEVQPYNYLQCLPRHFACVFSSECANVHTLYNTKWNAYLLLLFCSYLCKEMIHIAIYNHGATLHSHWTEMFKQQLLYLYIVCLSLFAYQDVPGIICITILLLYIATLECGGVASWFSTCVSKHPTLPGILTTSTDGRTSRYCLDSQWTRPFSCFGAS